MNNLDKWKMIYGFTILIVLGTIAITVGLGKVEQATSFGLQEIVTALVILSAGFAHWAFGEARTTTATPISETKKDSNE